MGPVRNRRGGCPTGGLILSLGPDPGSGRRREADEARGKGKGYVDGEAAETEARIDKWKTRRKIDRHGSREDSGGASGDANRLQLACQFHFF